MRGLFALVALAALSGCTHNIGDSCASNVDCSPLGDRFCDVAAPGGYCTVEGCEFNTCPDNEPCIRFLTPRPDAPCVVTPPAGQSNGCAVDERCVCEELENGSCVGNLGHCAPESSERRWCQHRCGSDSDCRQGYKCRSTGMLGAEPAPSPDFPQGQPTNFCAPPRVGSC